MRYSVRRSALGSWVVFRGEIVVTVYPAGQWRSAFEVAHELAVLHGIGVERIEVNL